jgi:hypothetical protein
VVVFLVLLMLVLALVLMLVVMPAAVVVVMIVRMVMTVAVRVIVMMMLVGVPVRMIVVVIALVGVCRSLVNAEMNAFDLLPLCPVEVHVKIAEIELGEFPLEGRGLHSQVAKGADQHVTADTGEAV